MNATEAVLNVIQNYANFNGRARRSEYWWFALACFAVTVVLESLGALLGKGFLAGLLATVGGLFSLAVLVPSLAVTWRRLHDVGRPGTHFFFVLIPLVGGILLLVWLLTDSQPGANQYGPNPKENELV